MLKTLFPTSAMTQCQVSWRDALERIRVCGFWFHNLIRTLNQSLSTEWCIATVLFWRSCRRISQKSGPLFLALYLKQCRVCLQRYCAGDKTPPTLSPAVSLTRCGLPRIIPAFHRVSIRAGDLNVIRLYMSLFSLAKFIDLAKRVTSKLFLPITGLKPNTSEFKDALRAYFSKAPILMRRYVPAVTGICLEQQYSPAPTWKTIPSWSMFRGAVRRKAKRGDEIAKRAIRYLKSPSCFVTYPLEKNMSFVTPRMAALFSYERYRPFDPKNEEKYLLHFKRIAGRSTMRFMEQLVPSGFNNLMVSPKICMQCSGEGKRRLFTIGNLVRQQLLRPLHLWCEEMLSRIDMDGTFDQIAPLNRLINVRGCVYSVDLTAATDRFPVDFSSAMIQALFGASLAMATVVHTLVMNLFRIDFLKKESYQSYLTGQPLGYLSSWPLFALSHHLLVWLAAEQVLPGRVFKRYALLGDDVIIADDAVYSQYIKLLGVLGVSVSESKSLTSKTGAAEFAKRFRLRQLQDDVSPISLKRISRSREPIGWINFIQSLHEDLPLHVALRIGGFGFKASSRPIGCVKHGRRARYFIALWTYHSSKRRGIFSMRGLYSAVLGHIVHHQAYAKAFRLLMKSFAPRPPKGVPDSVLAMLSQAELDLIEYDLLRPWMAQYCNYQEWYARLFIFPCVTIDYLMEAPVFIRTWNAPRIDLENYRFGAIYRSVNAVFAFTEADLVPELSEYNSQDSRKEEI